MRLADRFTEWLVKKYGMEKYADFWYRAGEHEGSDLYVCL